MAKAMTLISSQVLGSSQATVTFSSIPNTYRDLRLVWRPVVTTQANEQINFNGDSGNNYSVVITAFNWQPAIQNGTGTSTKFSDSWGYPGSGNVYGGDMSILDVLDYAQTDKHKAIFWRSNGNPTAAGGGGMDQIAGRWASTSAVNSIVLSLTGGSFNTGSTFYLYGIAG